MNHETFVRVQRDPRCRPLFYPKPEDVHIDQKDLIPSFIVFVLAVFMLASVFWLACILIT